MGRSLPGSRPHVSAPRCGSSLGSDPAAPLLLCLPCLPLVLSAAMSAPLLHHHSSSCDIHLLFTRHLVLALLKMPLGVMSYLIGLAIHLVRPVTSPIAPSTSIHLVVSVSTHHVVMCHVTHYHASHAICSLIFVVIDSLCSLLAGWRIVTGFAGTTFCSRFVCVLLICHFHCRPLQY